MQDVLKKFEAVLNEQDLVSVPQGVEKLIKLYVTRSTDKQLRKSLCELLERKAAESSSRALTAYLRAVCRCVSEHEKTDESSPRLTIPKPGPEAVMAQPRTKNTALGSYLEQLRKST
jgi:hypothetical protein